MAVRGPRGGLYPAARLIDSLLGLSFLIHEGNVLDSISKAPGAPQSASPCSLHSFPRTAADAVRKETLCLQRPLRVKKKKDFAVSKQVVFQRETKRLPPAQTTHRTCAAWQLCPPRAFPRPHGGQALLPCHSRPDRRFSAEAVSKGRQEVSWPEGVQNLPQTKGKNNSYWANRWPLLSEAQKSQSTPVLPES